MESQKRGILFAFIAVFLWATLGVGFKLAVSRLDSFVVTVYVGLFATLALLLNLVYRRKTEMLLNVFKKNWVFFILVGIIGLGIQQIVYLKAYQLLPASQVVVLFYLYPLLMVLLSSIFFREKTSLVSYLFILFGFTGVYIFISGGSLLNIQLSLGVIMTLLASLSWALFSVLIKHKKFDVDIGMFLFNLFGLLFLVALIPFFGFTFNLFTGEIICMIYLGIFPTALAFIIWNKALHLTKTHICSNIALLTPLVSLILIVIILKEKIILSQIVGLVVIIGSVFLNLRYGKK
ncbi:MAG: DMT family transporter [archaeon]